MVAEAVRSAVEVAAERTDICTVVVADSVAAVSIDTVAAATVQLPAAAVVPVQVALGWCSVQ